MLVFVGLNFQVSDANHPAEWSGNAGSNELQISGSSVNIKIMFIQFVMNFNDHLTKMQFNILLLHSKHVSRLKLT